MKDKTRRYEATWGNTVYNYYSSHRNGSRDNLFDLRLSMIEDFGINRASDIFLEYNVYTCLSVRDD